MRGIFITGTDTNVGKTFLSSLLLKALSNQGQRMGAYKPACSGAVFRGEDPHPIWQDVEVLSDAIGHKFPAEWICPQCFLASLAPPVAARQEGKEINEGLLLTGLDVWNQQADGIVVEGVGGWKCPLLHGVTIETLAQQIGFPVLVVAAHKLGAINHTLLTVDAVRQAGLSVAGVILNQPSADQSDFLNSNAEQIWDFANVPFLALTGFEHQGELRCWKTSRVVDLWEMMSPSSTHRF